MADERAEPQPAVRFADEVEFVQPVDVDQDTRPQHAEIQQRHEALAAGQELGIAAVARQQRHRLGKARGPMIIEWRRLHPRLDIALPSSAAARGTQALICVTGR